jgi:hypothetical protein
LRPCRLEDVGRARVLRKGFVEAPVELVAARRRFVAIPLASHFEQRFHVRHRLERYGATTRLDYSELTPDRLGTTLSELLASTPWYRAVDGGGADRAAALIAELL